MADLIAIPLAIIIVMVTIAVGLALMDRIYKALN